MEKNSRPHDSIAIVPIASEFDLRRRIATLEQVVEEQRAILADRERALLAIRNSRGFKVLERCYHLRDKLLPARSLQRSAARRVFHSARMLCRAAIALAQVLSRQSPEQQYKKWRTLHEPNYAALKRQKTHKFSYEPVISIIVPAGTLPPEYLHAAVQSVWAQTYSGWELWIQEQGQTATSKIVLDPRIKQYPWNDTIASGDVLAKIQGQYVAWLHPGDMLAPWALYEIVRALNEHQAAELIYSDQDQIDEQGRRRFDPLFKPDWSPDLLRSQNYVGGIAVYAIDLVRRVGGRRPEFTGAEDYDLALRASERASCIVHIPCVLYHRRVGAVQPDAALASASSQRALHEHLQRLGVSGTVRPTTKSGIFQVLYDLPRQPLLSIIIPTKDQCAMLERCLRSIEKSSYPRFELIILENRSEMQETFDFYKELEQNPRVRILQWDHPFNYAAINNFGCRHARGEVFLFLNNDVEAINAGFLERMLEHAIRPEVGAVGAKLYYPDDTIQHAGVVIGLGCVADHGHKFFARNSSGYANRLVAIHNVSALTGACLMVRKSVFDEAGGFDERFVLAFNDVDLCLRIRQRGYFNVWTPHAELYHWESKTRGHEDTPEKQARFQQERDLFHAKWKALLLGGDPFYNPNLTRDRLDFSIRL
jgi:GT2 family glycosyltransferase